MRARSELSQSRGLHVSLCLTVSVSSLLLLGSGAGCAQADASSGEWLTCEGTSRV